MFFPAILIRKVAAHQLSNHTYHHIRNVHLEATCRVLNNLDRIRKQCLWRGNDRSKKGGNLAAWPMVLKPKSKGGLGVQNLRLQNDALLLKQLTKFYS